MRPHIDDISVRHLRYALAIADAGSVSAAADILHVAQPSLSQQLRKLEMRLNTELFERTHAGLKPTAAGQNFLTRAGAVVAGLEDAVNELCRTNTPWRLGISPGLSSDLVGTVETAVTHENADQRVVLSSAPSNDLLHLLEHGALDFGLVRAPFDHPMLVYTTVAIHELGVVVARDHPLTLHETVSWDSLDPMRLLWFASERAPGFAADVLNHLAAHGWTPEQEEGPDRHALFQRRLLADPTLVALRPAYAIEAEPPLRWLPFENDPPIERLAVAAVRGTRAAEIIAGISPNEGNALYLHTD